MANETTFTISCGLLPTRKAHSMNITVPMANTMMFQGYITGPIALKACPSTMATAPVHCKMLSMFLYVMSLL